MRYFGLDPENLPVKKKNLMICYHKIVDTTSGDNRTCQFHAIYDNERYVITATYIKKRKLLELRHGKKTEIFRGKHLSDSGLFPV